MDGPTMEVANLKFTKAAIEYLRKIFGYDNFTSETQKNTILRVLRRESNVDICLPHGCGIKLEYELPAFMAAMDNDKWTVVLTGWSSLTETRISSLQSLGVHCSKFGDLSENDFENEQSFVDAFFEELRLRFIANDPTTEKPGLLYVPVVLSSISSIIGLLIQLLDAQGLLAFIVVDELSNQWKFKNVQLTDVSKSLWLLKNKFAHIPWVSVSYDEEPSCNKIEKKDEEPSCNKIEKEDEEPSCNKIEKKDEEPSCNKIEKEDEELSKKINKIWDDLVLFYKEVEERENKIQKE